MKRLQRPPLALRASCLTRRLLLALLLAHLGTHSLAFARGKTFSMQESLDVLRQSNASLRRIVLDNGLIGLIKEDRAAPVVSIHIWVGVGSIHEQAYMGAGLSHAIEHMIFKGTEKRRVGDITREINDAGGSINAYTSFDRTVFHVNLPSRKWMVGLDVLADAVMRASFPADEWKKERKVILREIAMGKDDPNRVLSKLLWRTAYTVHPYRFPVIGYTSVFEALTNKDLKGFARQNYVSDNMIVVVVGDIDAAEVEAEIRGTFADFSRTARAPVVLPAESAQIAPRFARQTGPYNVSRLEWAYHAAPFCHADTAALDILAQIVGHGRSSRLNMKLCEDARLAHSISAWSYTPKDPGLFGISAVFSPDKEHEALKAIQEEIQSWQTTLLPQKDIDKACRMLLAQELAELQTMNGQAYNYAAGEFYAGNPRFSETYLEEISKMTPKRLRAVARKYLRRENKTLAILSPEPEEKKKTTKQPKAPAIRAERIRLHDSHIPLIVREDHKLPFVYMCAVLRGGLLSENKTNSGITRLMSDLLIRGTKRRSNQDIAQTVESLGGVLSPFSGYNSFGLQARCLTQDTETFVKLLADCLLNARFAPQEIEKQRDLQIAAIDQAHDRPFFLAQQGLRDLLFPDHPYGWPPMGKRKTVLTITADDLRSFYERHVSSRNLVLAMFGDIRPRQAAELAEKYFKKIRRGPPPKQTLKKPKAPLPARTKRREPNEQSILLVGFPSVDMKHSSRDAIVALESTLSGLSSDLATEIREKRGLVYYVGAYERTGLHPGEFVIYAGTREEDIARVEQLIKDEIQRVTSQGVRKEEFQRAINRLVAQHEMDLQNNLSMATTCALNELYGLGYNYLFTAPERFQALTPADVRDAASLILSTNKPAISLLLPQTKTKDAAK